jgi:hypothetical protein
MAYNIYDQGATTSHWSPEYTRLKILEQMSISCFLKHST